MRSELLAEEGIQKPTITIILWEVELLRDCCYLDRDMFIS